MLLLFALYGTSGCLAVMSLYLDVIGLSIGFAAGALMLLAAYWPRVLTAIFGALVFAWVPATAGSILALCGLIEFEWGRDAAALLLCLFAAYVTPAVVIVSMLSALIMRLIFPIPKHQEGHCTSCDYNLRGLRSDRCPECGTSFRVSMPADTGFEGTAIRVSHRGPKIICGRADRLAAKRVAL